MLKINVSRWRTDCFKRVYLTAVAPLFIADEPLIALAQIAPIMPRWLVDPGASLGGESGRRGIIRDSALYVISCRSVA
jgi:hypothetical protein